MWKSIFIRGWKLALIACLTLPVTLTAGQFVQVDVETEINSWDYWALTDHRKSTGAESKPSIFTRSVKTRCVVGTNTWMMETITGDKSKETFWFTGTNLIQHDVTFQQNPKSLSVGLSDPGRELVQSTWVHETNDGNPGRPVRVADLIFYAHPKFAWLACCSGPAVKREGRKIYPTGVFWKELMSEEWTDETSVFKDGLGLPESITLSRTNGQPVFQYHVRQTTNVMGWTFPLEFYAIQYRPARTEGWALDLTLKGKVTAIGVGEEPRIPAEVEAEVRRKLR